MGTDSDQHKYPHCDIRCVAYLSFTTTLLPMSEFAQSATEAATPPGGSPKLERFKKAILQAAKEHHDPWEKHQIDKVPAERVRRHRYLPESGKWVVDESLVKIQPEPFDHGSMRIVFRMKKISQVQLTAWNKVAWSSAPNYVAKRYKADAETGSEVNREHYFEDIQLQYEASKWADVYNAEDPPKKIKVIQCYVIEFFERPGSPVFGCERFVDGHDKHGAGFVKHNSNSGFVEDMEARMTPQTFSAHSFYRSSGTRMVVDVQGVGDLYTDPQVHSIDCRFGDGDLGHRGMALFFGTFYRSSLCEFFKLPVFVLSEKQRARLKPPKTEAVQDAGGYLEAHEAQSMKQQENRLNRRKAWLAEKFQNSCSFSILTPEKQMASFRSPSKADLAGEAAEDDGESTAEFALSPEDQREIKRALEECEGHAIDEISSLTAADKTRSPDDVMQRSELDINVALLHFELSLLEASGRFSEDLFDPVPDLSSCAFQLCQASMRGNTAAALALGRLRNGLSTAVITVADVVVPQNAESAKLFLQLAALRGSLSAACLAAKLLHSSGDKDAAIIMYRKALQLMDQKELAILNRSRPESSTSVSPEYAVGDDVEVNYYCCGSWYPAKVTEVLSNPARYIVSYDDGSVVEETAAENVRNISTEVRKTVQSASNIEKGTAEMAEEGVSYFVNSDETSFILPRFEVLGDLGTLLLEQARATPPSLSEEKVAIVTEIEELLNEASSLAMEDGKMKIAMKFLDDANTASSAF